MTLLGFVCADHRRRRGADKFGMTESTVNFAGRGDGLPDYGANATAQRPGGPQQPPLPLKSPVYAINGAGGHPFRSNSFSAQRFGSAYGSFSNSCLGTSLTSMRIRNEARVPAPGSPLAAAESHI